MKERTVEHGSSLYHCYTYDEPEEPIHSVEDQAPMYTVVKQKVGQQ